MELVGVIVGKNEVFHRAINPELERSELGPAVDIWSPRFGMICERHVEMKGWEWDPFWPPYSVHDF